MWIPYCGAAPLPPELWARWNLDLLLIGVLAVATAAGLRGGADPRRFIAGMAVLALLFVSPLCALTSALFAARTVHHLALTAIAAPLIAAAWPARRVPGGVAAWTAAHAAIMWLWHAPPAYHAALSSDALYWLMQASLLASAVALWRAVRAAPLPAAIGALLATMVQMGLLGALLTFAAGPLYAPHMISAPAWGLAPIEDQQLAGLIMWAPGAGLYLAAAVMLLARWFARERAAAAIAT